MAGAHRRACAGGRGCSTSDEFDAVRFRGPGTDLVVGLMPESRWLTGEVETLASRKHLSNMPTEEVFTTPHRLRTEGVVRSTAPLALQGRSCEGWR